MRTTANLLPVRVAAEPGDHRSGDLQALLSVLEEDEREQYVLMLKIEFSALRHAGGRLNTELIQGEAARMLQSGGHQLRQHSPHLHKRISTQLHAYFKSGRWSFPRAGCSGLNSGTVS